LRVNRKYLVAVALLAVLAVAFGLAGTVAPVSELPSSSSSSDSVTHFANPPTFDSGWVDITTKLGQYIPVMHGLNTTEVVVDITGKQSLDPMSGALGWSRTYGGAYGDVARSVVQTSDGGYAIAGYTDSFDAGLSDFWLVKTDSAGIMQWSQTYDEGGDDLAYSVVQTFDGGYAIAGYSGGDFWLVKTDSAGIMQWSQPYYGGGDDGAYSVVQTSDGGYALAGYTNSFGAGHDDFWLVKTGAGGNVEWNQTYGGANSDVAWSVVQTDDGGYAIAGWTQSPSAGDYDFWLVKTDQIGNMQWNKTYGGTGDDGAYSLVQTSDGGYAIAGYTDSFDAGLSDFWLVKTDSAGIMQWSQTYGGLNHDLAYSVIQTFDGGYAIAGYSGGDFWLVKTDLTGTALWSQTYGGGGDDGAYSLVQTFDGGYALAGYTDTFDRDNDFWLVKVKGEINLENQRNFGGTGYIPGWSQTYGGTDGDYAYSVVQTSDGGYAIAGCTYSFGVGERDFWLVKTDSVGNMQWSKTYGGVYDDVAQSVVQTFDGGYAIAGSTVTDFLAPTDLWLVKTDSAGNMQWSLTYGGVNDDYAYSVVQTSDGGYAVAGSTEFYPPGGPYDFDFWLVKTDPVGKYWSQTYGGASNDYAYSVVQTSDGGYTLAGSTYSFGAGQSDFWLVKTDSAGNMLWNRTYGGTNDDGAYSVVQTFDDGYAIAGSTESYGAGSADFYLVKTDSSGNEQWNKTYGGDDADGAYSVVETGDGGYAIAGLTASYGAGGSDFWLVKTDPVGNMQWSQTYGGANDEHDCSVVQTFDDGYAIAGETWLYGAESADFWLVKTDTENGLAWTGLTNYTIILYRGETDPYWNYVRVRIWTIKEPTWMFGDINMDGIVDAKDLAIIGKNYGKTFSALSLGGIIAIAGIYTYKKRKQKK